MLIWKASLNDQPINEGNRHNVQYMYEDGSSPTCTRAGNRSTRISQFLITLTHMIGDTITYKEPYQYTSIHIMTHTYTWYQVTEVVNFMCCGKCAIIIITNLIVYSNKEYMYSTCILNFKEHIHV